MVDEEINIGFFSLLATYWRARKGSVSSKLSSAESIGIEVKARETLFPIEWSFKVVGAKRFHPGERFLEWNVSPKGTR